MRELKLGVYRHFRTHENYLVIGIAKHSETLEDLAIYIPLYENDKARIWARPLKMFLEDVEADGVKVARYEYIGER